MTIDSSNIEFQRAFRLITQTKRNVFLTGRAGTGKTTFLKYLRDCCPKSMAIVAPTGIAAINAGGMTIHSLFQIKPGFNAPNEAANYEIKSAKRQLLEGIELLIIDEVSMVRRDLLEAVDRTCRLFGLSHLPFGGKQVLFIGDPFQLPAFVGKEERDIYSRFYDSVFFFKSKAFWDCDPLPIELKKIYRQNEKAFIDLLNKIRVKDLSQNDLNLLNTKDVGPDFPFAKQDYLYLGTKNEQVSTINDTELRKLPGHLHSFNGKKTGTFPDEKRPTEMILSLKEGAQIIFVKNDTGGNRYYNGKMGKICQITSEGIQVQFASGEKHFIEEVTWESIKYEWDEKEKKVIESIEGTFTQYPIKLAWAITVHKSQGLSLERVYAAVQDSWDSGQVYVALSRCTTFDGLKLASAIPMSAIKVSQEVQDFYKWVLEQGILQEQPPVITSLITNKSRLTQPEEITLEWDVQGASSITINGQQLPVSSKKWQVWPKKERSFTLIAENAFGVSTRRTIKIEVDDRPPVIHFFKSSKSEFRDKSPAILSWSVDGAETLSISGIGNITGDKAPFFASENCTITLIAESYFGAKSQAELSFTVIKTPPVIESFSANYPFAVSGMQIELFWNIQNVEKVHIEPGGWMPSSNIGTHVATIETNSTFLLTAWSPLGVQSQQSITVQTIPVPLIESILVPLIQIESHLNIKVDTPEYLPEKAFHKAYFHLVELDTTNVPLWVQPSWLGSQFNALKMLLREKIQNVKNAFK